MIRGRDTSAFLFITGQWWWGRDLQSLQVAEIQTPKAT